MIKNKQQQQPISQININVSIVKQNITEEILINEAHWISITREVFSYMKGRISRLGFTKPFSLILNRFTQTNEMLRSVPVFIYNVYIKLKLKKKTHTKLKHRTEIDIIA